MFYGLSFVCLGLFLLGRHAAAFTVPIRDTDDLREVCSGMWGGSVPYIDVTFDPSSSGQVALVIYEWNDVPYLGVDTPSESVGGLDMPKTYICTNSAAQMGLCSQSQLGEFITSLPAGVSLESTSIFSQAIRFGSDPLPSSGGDAVDIFEPIPTEDEDQETGGQASQDQPAQDEDDAEPATDYPQGGISFDETTPSEDQVNEDTSVTDGAQDSVDDGDDVEDVPAEDDGDKGKSGGWFSGWWKRDQPQQRQTGILDGVTGALQDMQGGSNDDDEPHGVPFFGAADAQEENEDAGDEPTDGEDQPAVNDEPVNPEQGQDGGEDTQPGNEGSQGGLITYTSPIHYEVKKTGYYCVGIIPVTLIGSRELSPRQAQHAEYSGEVLFRNTFDGELPAVEYPKILFYLILSILYVALGGLWAILAIEYRTELLPIQYYISGTIVFLIIEMMANFGYYRYINKHGSGASSLAFLFVVAVFNAARNSLSFFLLLIVSMGLSVVTQSLGSVMNRVRTLTAFHFIFGVLYAVGTVEVELDSASLIIVLILIFPLSLTLTAFLMWIIVSLNGTIFHLRAQKQRFKLQMFQKLWRILIVAVIAVAAFFVISSMSLSNRLDADYAPNNWRYRWILLDGSLSTIYLVAFASIAFLWRPTRDNVRFSMSQELAQDEAEADAGDYEFDTLENGRVNHQPLPQDDFDEEGDEDESRPFKPGMNGHGREVGEENVVFQMGDDSDEEENSKSPKSDHDEDSDSATRAPKGKQD